MNGQLRELEVVVREGFLQGVRACDNALRDGYGEFAASPTLRD